MNFTFAICTSLNKISNNKILFDTETIPRIHKIIDDIEKLKIKNYEILIAGLNHIDRKNTTCVMCPDKISPTKTLNSLGYVGDFTEEGGWFPGHITKKKNVMAKLSKYENIVFSHDYYTYDEDWYDGYLRFGNDFKVCCNRVFTIEGDRYLDWMVWPFNGNKLDTIVSSGVDNGHSGRECLIPYDVTHLSKYMYVQGSYWVSKKEVMMKFPLDENKVWGEGEDVQWSMIYRNYPGNYFSINQRSTCRLLKPKKTIYKECSPETKLKLLRFNNG